MHSLALMLPLVLGDFTPRARFERYVEPAADTADPTTDTGGPTPRRSGLQVETALGGGTLSAASEDAWVSLTGVTLRTQLGFRFLLSDRWRLGPMFAASVSWAQATDVRGATVRQSYGAFTLAPELEAEIGHGLSVVSSLGVALAAERGLHLGPEVSLGFVQSVAMPRVGRRMGFALRGVVAPIFPLDTPSASAGYFAQVTFGLAAGVP